MAHDLPAIKVNCPDCSGVISLDRDAETGHLRYVCQVGHAYSVEEMAVAKEEQIENALWSVINLLEHSELIYGHLLEEAKRGILPLEQTPLEGRVQQSEDQRRQLRRLLDSIRLPTFSTSKPRIDPGET